MEEKIGILNRILKLNLIRDLNYLFSGLFILLIINFIFKPSLDLYPNIEYFGVLGRYLSIGIFAYFISRIFYEIGGFIIHIFYFLVSKSRKNDYEEFVGYINSMCDLKSKEKENNALDLKNNMIFHAETMQYLYDKPEMHSLYERHAQKLMYETIFLGFTFTLIFFTNNKFITFIIFLVILFRAVKTKFNFSDLHTKITILLAREKQDKAPF